MYKLISISSLSIGLHFKTNKEAKKVASSVKRQALAGTACLTCVLLIKRWAEAFDYIS